MIHNRRRRGRGGDSSGGEGTGGDEPWMAPPAAPSSLSRRQRGSRWRFGTTRLAVTVIVVAVIGVVIGVAIGAVIGGGGYPSLGF